MPGDNWLGTGPYSTIIAMTLLGSATWVQQVEKIRLPKLSDPQHIIFAGLGVAHSLPVSRAAVGARIAEALWGLCKPAVARCVRLGLKLGQPVPMQL